MSLMKESKRLAQEMKKYKGTCEDINTYDDIIASDDEVFSVSERIMEQNQKINRKKYD